MADDLRTPERDSLAKARPATCPECGSKAVGTLAKQITAATYWRCHQCGAVWNATRNHGGLPRRM